MTLVYFISSLIITVITSNVVVAATGSALATLLFYLVFTVRMVGMAVEASREDV